MYDQFSFDTVVASLEKVLKAPLPGEDFQFLMAPEKRRELSYYDPADPAVRKSSVMILIYPDSNKIATTVLIRRPEYQGAHSGQIAFPGGKLEGEETIAAAAIRETYEEIGVSPEKLFIKGALTPLYIPVSKFIVHPVVGIMHQAPVFQPDAHEVAEVLPTRLTDLVSFKSKPILVDTSYGQLQAPAYHSEQFIIWGATAMIISEFREVLSRTL